MESCAVSVSECAQWSFGSVLAFLFLVFLKFPVSDSRPLDNSDCSSDFVLQ